MKLFAIFLKIKGLSEHMNENEEKTLYIHRRIAHRSGIYLEFNFFFFFLDTLSMLSSFFVFVFVFFKIK